MFNILSSNKKSSKFSLHIYVKLTGVVFSFYGVTVEDQ